MARADQRLARQRVRAGEREEHRDLALAIVDEQHRFGVHQRLALARKGEAVDVLVMTATPIPRTLLMTHYGDLDVSRLTEKPAGRKPVTTTLVATDRISAFDVVLPTSIPGKGRVLTGLSLYWFEQTKGLIANHLPPDTVQQVQQSIHVSLVLSLTLLHRPSSYRQIESCRTSLFLLRRHRSLAFLVLPPAVPDPKKDK